MTMPTPRRTRRASGVVLAALALSIAGIASAGTASAAPAGAAATRPADAGDQPQNAVTRAALDAIWPMPAEDANEFSDSERIAGVLGLNEMPGGPLGWWPRPANPTADAGYGAIPGAGPYGDVSGATGLTPRSPYAGGHTDTPKQITLNPAPGPALCGAPTDCLLDLALVPVFSILHPPQADSPDSPPATAGPAGPGKRTGTATRVDRTASASDCGFPVDCLLDVIDPQPAGESNSAPVPIEAPTAPGGRHHHKG